MEAAPGVLTQGSPPIGVHGCLHGKQEVTTLIVRNGWGPPPGMAISRTLLLVEQSMAAEHR